MSPSQPSSERLSPAEEALAAFFVQRDRGDQVSFAAYCAERPALARDLRALYEQWRAFDAVAGGAFGAASLESADGSGKASRWIESLRRRGGGERYVEVAEIGRGRTGRVLEVFDRDLRRHVAMKVLRDGADRESTERFLHQAHLTGRLQHPGIVPIHDLGCDARGRFFYTMPLVRGESLQRVFERLAAGEAGRCLGAALDALIRVCETIGYAHGAGVAHGDLGPTRVLVGSFGEALVLGWGRTAHAEAEQGRPTAIPREATGAAGDVDSLCQMVHDVLSAGGAAVEAAELEAIRDEARARDAAAMKLAADLRQLLRRTPPTDSRRPRRRR